MNQVSIHFKEIRVTVIDFREHRVVLARRFFPSSELTWCSLAKPHADNPKLLRILEHGLLFRQKVAEQRKMLRRCDVMETEKPIWHHGGPRDRAHIPKSVQGHHPYRNR